MLLVTDLDFECESHCRRSSADSVSCALLFTVFSAVTTIQQPQSLGSLSTVSKSKILLIAVQEIKNEY